MTAKEYLSQAFHLDRKIKARLLEVERLNETARTATSILDGMPIGDGMHRSRMEEAVCRIIDLEAEISNHIVALVALKRQIDSVIASVNDLECEAVLSMRYLSFMRWEEIAAEYGCSLENIYHIHRKALSLVRIPN